MIMNKHGSGEVLVLVRGNENVTHQEKLDVITGYQSSKHMVIIATATRILN
jgi:hypothetical protein